MNLNLKRYGIETNMHKSKVVRTSLEHSSLQIMVDQKQPENVKYFNYFGSLITNNARCTRELKSRTVMAKKKQHSTGRRLVVTNKLHLNLRKELLKFYIWSMALYGAET